MKVLWSVSLCGYLNRLPAKVTFCPQVAIVSKEALDEGLAKKLWEKSEALVGLKAEEMDF
jgi:hypothetical protein